MRNRWRVLCADRPFGWKGLKVGKLERLAGGNNAIVETRCLLADGKIIAVKGLGGFHLACDATNAKSVIELRTRKLRVDKPFALMMPDLETIEKHCIVSNAERELLTSTARPIVLLKRRPESDLAKGPTVSLIHYRAIFVFLLY